MATATIRNELVLQDPAVVKDHVVSARPSFASLPTSLDYREKGLLTTDLNQHIPVYWFVTHLDLSVDLQ